MADGKLCVDLEVVKGSWLLLVPVSLESFTVISLVFLVPAEAVKEATENMARNKLQMMIKRVIKKIYDTILHKRYPLNKVGNA